MNNDSNYGSWHIKGLSVFYASEGVTDRSKKRDCNDVAKASKFAATHAAVDWVSCVALGAAGEAAALFIAAAITDEFVGSLGPLGIRTDEEFKGYSHLIIS